MVFAMSIVYKMISNTLHNITPEMYQQVCELNAEQAIKITSLELSLLQMQKIIFGFKSEAFKPSPEISALQGLLFNEEPLAVIENTPETKTIQINNFKIKPNPKKHNGRNLLPENIRREEVIIEPSDIPEGAKKIGEEVTEELEYKKAEIFVTRTVRPKYALPGGEGVVIAPMVERALPKCIAAPSLIANIIIEKFVDHLPVYRQIDRLKRLGVELNESTIGGWFKAIHRLLTPLYDALKKEVLLSKYLHVDESTIKVLDKDKKGTTHLGYYWLYHDSIRNLIWYDYHKSRGMEAPNQVLKDFSGHLQTDGYAAYEHFDLDPNITHLCCIAHARRKFFDAQDNDKERSEYFLQKMHILYSIEREIKGLPADERLNKRITEAQPVLIEIKEWLLTEIAKVLPKSPIGIAIAYSLTRWDKLSIYATTDFLNIDNNPIENKVRPLAIGRKNYLFAGSHEAATRNGMLYSILVTCKMNNIEPQDWLTYVITNIPSHPINKISELLPHKINPNLLG
jgi:transposase